MNLTVHKPSTRRAGARKPRAPPVEGLSPESKNRPSVACRPESISIRWARRCATDTRSGQRARRRRRATGRRDPDAADTTSRPLANTPDGRRGVPCRPRSHRSPRPAAHARPRAGGTELGTPARGHVRDGSVERLSGGAIAAVRAVGATERDQARGSTGASAAKARLKGRWRSAASRGAWRRRRSQPAPPARSRRYRRSPSRRASCRRSREELEAGTS